MTSNAGNLDAGAADARGPARVFSLTRPPVATLVLAVIALAVYLNTVGFDFVYDDLYLVAENAEVHTLRNPARFFLAPMKEVTYRPLVYLWFALDHAIAGGRPWFFHLENVLLHVAVTLLVYRLLLAVAGETAWLAALLFAVTPIHTEVVANVISRTELLSALLALAALLTLKRVWLAALLFLLALMSKESAVAVPALALLLFYRFTVPREHGGAPAAAPVSKPFLTPRRAALLTAAFAAALAVFMVLRWHAIRHVGWPPLAMLDNPLMYSDLSTRLRTGLMVLGQNLVLSVAPYHLSADYTFPQTRLITRWLDAQFILWTTVLLAAIAAALAAWRTRPNLARGLAWWLVAILPLSNLLLVMPMIRAERWLYLPSVGTCLVMAELLWLLRPARRRWAAVLIGVLVAVLGARAAMRNEVWRSQEAIFFATANDAPHSIRAIYQLGDYLRRRGDCPAAIPYFQRVLAIYPAFGMARYNLAACYEKLGRLEDAEPLYLRLFAANPGDRGLAEALTAVCEKRQEWTCVADALQRFVAANQQAGGDASAWLTLGNALQRAGRLAESESAYRHSIALREDAVSHFNLAGLLVKLGRPDEAIEHYEAAERLGMKNEALYQDLAAARLRKAGSRKQ